ncbi:MAG TPA: YbdK family carboxylate-amine ligase [Planctomycetaceae bacterium]|nr:YbdK family carboxylate-amine ligase [Planctomycetaceae bacterium]
MSALKFTRNEYPTIGVEIELQLLDAETLELSSAIDAILKRVPKDMNGFIKPELMQSYVELNTGICRTVAEVREDLKAKLAVLDEIAESLGLRLLWAATHPFSSWRQQKITVNERYERLVGLMQDVARRLLTFGLHVHIGVDSGDKAIMICDRMLRHLPLLLALSSNSPFWEGRCTGLHSNRSKIMEGLPTAGLPYRMRNWSEYVWLVNHLMETGFINSIREIWWDIRPHYIFGTVEIRVCDMPANLNQTLALTALIQCLVQAISDEIDEGTYQSDYHPMMVQQNKWRATRFGPEAHLVNTDSFQQEDVPEVAARMVQLLQPVAKQLGCLEELQTVAQLPAATGSLQQLRIFERTGDRREVVRQMLQQNDWRRLDARLDGVRLDVPSSEQTAS